MVVVVCALMKVLLAVLVRRAYDQVGVVERGMGVCTTKVNGHQVRSRDFTRDRGHSKGGFSKTQ